MYKYPDALAELRVGPLFLFLIWWFTSRYAGVDNGAVWIVPTLRIRLSEATLSPCDAKGRVR